MTGFHFTPDEITNLIVAGLTFGGVAISLKRQHTSAKKLEVVNKKVDTANGNTIGGYVEEMANNQQKRSTDLPDKEPV